MQFFNWERVSKYIVAYRYVWRSFSKVDTLPTSNISPTRIKNSTVIYNYLMRIIYENAIDTGIEYANISHDDIGWVLNINSELVESDWA